MFLFIFKQKTAYELRISDWSSDVCSSDLAQHVGKRQLAVDAVIFVLRVFEGLFAQPRLAARLDIERAGIEREAARYIDTAAPLAILRQAQRRAFALVEFVHRRVEKRSEERRVGKEGVSTCRSRWPQHP